MLREICKKRTNLSEEDICQLEDLSRQLPIIAELIQADLFIDCVVNEETAVVVAQASPTSMYSMYEKTVVSEDALIGNEPAVFHAFRTNAPVRDIKAITQENRTVSQSVCPIHNPHGQVIGVLIQETDISQSLSQEKKLEALAKNYEDEDRPLRSEWVDNREVNTLRETHHRIKNSLQLVASILNLQARKHRGTETEKILVENVGRVLAISTIHDILTQTQDQIDRISSLALLEKLVTGLQAFVPEEKQIQITVQGDEVELNGGQAGSIALVVNELITNALEHAFEESDSGIVQVSFRAGKLFHTVTVSDNGSGFPADFSSEDRLGLRIAETTVRSKLKGNFHVYSDLNGTQISFDIKKEIL